MVPAMAVQPHSIEALRGKPLEAQKSARNPSAALVAQREAAAYTCARGGSPPFPSLLARASSGATGDTGRVTSGKVGVCVAAPTSELSPDTSRDRAGSRYQVGTQDPM